MFNANNMMLKEIDFSAVGATNVKPLNINDKLIKEKLSVLIMANMMGNLGGAFNLRYSEYIHPCDVRVQRGSSGMQMTLPLYFTATRNEKIYKATITDPFHVKFEEFTTDPLKQICIYCDDPYCIPVRPGASFESISLFDLTRKVQSYPDEVREHELFSYFETEGNAYAPFKLGTKFVVSQSPSGLESLPKGRHDDFCKFQRELGRCYAAGFPRSYSVHTLKQVPHPTEMINMFRPRMIYRPVLSSSVSVKFPSPIFYEPLGPMAYDLNAYHRLPFLRLQRLFFNPDTCGLRQALIPTVNVGLNTVMTVVPNGKKLPIYNANRVKAKKTDIVVVCGCVEDAEALQRANPFVAHVAFTAYYGEDPDQSDWGPIAGKPVAFLISNHSGKTIEEEFEHIAKLHEYLANAKVRDRVRPAKLGIPEFTFVRRNVDYPDSDGFATPADLASAYYHHRPEVISGSVKDMDESEFTARLEMIRSEQSKLPVWLRPIESGKNDHDACDFLVRGILYKGATTELAAKSGTGKTRFGLWLGRFVVCGLIPFLKERLWTRSGNPSTPKKVVYWCFDDVNGRKVKAWRTIYKAGLADQFAENFFIDVAPESIRKNPDVKTYKKELLKYACQGKPGLPDLLIVDTLSDICGQEHIDEALNLLADLKRQAAPEMSVLALHHIGETDKILKGSSAKRKPRLILTMAQDNKKTGSISVRPADDCVLKLAYDPATNISFAPIEKNIPFFIRSNGNGGYEPVDPICSDVEFAKLLVDYYKRWDDNHLTNGEIGELFGCSESTVEKKFSAKPDELEKIYSMIETKLTQEKTEKASPKSKKKKTADALPDEADDLGEDEADELDEPDADEFPEEDDDSEEPEE